MSQFANYFSENEIRSQPVTQIPWSSLSRIIIPKSSSKEEALWYINQTYKNKWSRSVVLKQFELQAYQRGIIAPSTSTAEDGYVQEIEHFLFSRHSLSGQSPELQPEQCVFSLQRQHANPHLAISNSLFINTNPLLHMDYIRLLKHHEPYN